MNLSSKIVGSLMILSKLFNRVDQAKLSSKSDRAFTGGRKLNYKTWTSILKLLATVLTDIGMTRSRGQVSADSSK